MIVKKVPTSKRAPAKSKAHNVRALADYIAGPKAGGAGEKVEHRGALNLLNLDHEGQVQEMIDLAEMAKRSPQPVQHWIMSWREGEQPTAAQADEAVRMFLDEMGLAEPPGDLWAAPRHGELAPPPGRQPRPPRDGEARHRQQRLRPRGRPPGDRSHRARAGVAEGGPRPVPGAGGRAG